MMRAHTIRTWTLAAIGTAALVAACGGSTEPREDPGNQAGAGASGGSGGSATGGTQSGGTGGQPLGECTTDSECLAVMDTGDPCYAGNCSAPVWASLEDVASNPCLVPWDPSFSERPPPACDIVIDEPAQCNLMCALQPACVVPLCIDGRCGGEMIYDEAMCAAGGTGGIGGSGGSGGTVDECAALDAARREALEAAAACDPYIYLAQCIEGFTVPDFCGCDVPLNDDPDLAAAAVAAYDAWTAAGCGPLPCGAPCLGGDRASCVEQPDGTGRCSYGY